MLNISQSKIWLRQVKNKSDMLTDDSIDYDWRDLLDISKDILKWVARNPDKINDALYTLPHGVGVYYDERSRRSYMFMSRLYQHEVSNPKDICGTIFVASWDAALKPKEAYKARGRTQFPDNTKLSALLEEWASSKNHTMVSPQSYIQHQIWLLNQGHTLFNNSMSQRFLSVGHKIEDTYVTAKSLSSFADFMNVWHHAHFEHVRTHKTTSMDARSQWEVALAMTDNYNDAMRAQHAMTTVEREGYDTVVLPALDSNSHSFSSMV